MTRHTHLAVLAFALTALLWSPTNTLPQGAPESVCETLLPYHGGGIPPQTSPPPFRILTDVSVVGQSQPVRVQIVGEPRELEFKGFIIQARSTSPPYDIVGRFSPTTDGLDKLMNCAGGQDNSVTHTSTQPKTDMVFEWFAPPGFLGDVVFKASVAQTYDKFWVGIPSKPVEVVQGNPPPVIGISTTVGPTTTQTVFVPTTQKPQVYEDPFYKGCGTSKTCFGNPSGCVADRSCRAVGSVLVRGDIYEIELKSGYNSPAYVALGFSEDAKMGDDLVTECVGQQSNVGAFSSYTSGSPNFGVSRAGVPQNSARLLQGSVVNGEIYCKVQRDAVTVANGKRFDLVNNDYHLLIAAGSSLKETGAGYHDLGRLAADKPVKLSIVQELAGASPLLLRLHGAFMIAAWIGTTSLGIIFARYFKQTWVGSQACGKDQWFAWHRICMITTWSLTIAAFVIIFVEIGGWSGERNPHAILGVVTTALCFFQPIGAMFRPAPNASTRPIFNWLHWLGGNLAHILAIVTIFFAVKLTKAELPEWMDWILVAFVAFHVAVHIIFSIAGCSSDRKAGQRVNSFPMADMAGGRNNAKMDRKMDAPHAGFRKGLLGVYIVILALFVAALIVIVVLAPIEESFKSLKKQMM